MPYTLVKGLAWVLLALLLGGVVGWMLRSLTSRRQVAKARSTAAATAELERLRRRIAELEPAASERDRLRAELDAVVAEDSDAAAPAVPAAQPLATAPPAGVLRGRAITADDLVAVEGITPQIAALCHRIGVRTWWDLATTEVSLLRTMLTDAGSEFAAVDPSSWPEQARLLVEGRWAEFEALTDSLTAGPEGGDDRRGGGR